jgi:hypothetical protein
MGATYPCPCSELQMIRGEWSMAIYRNTRYSGVGIGASGCRHGGVKEVRYCD